MSGNLFVDDDGYGNPTIWRHTDNPEQPEALLLRTGANSEAFDALAAAIALADDLCAYNPSHGDYLYAGRRLRAALAAGTFSEES